MCWCWRNAAAADIAFSSVIVDDVMFVSSMSLDWLSRKLFWVDSAKVRILRFTPSIYYYGGDKNAKMFHFKNAN